MGKTLFVKVNFKVFAGQRDEMFAVFAGFFALTVQIIAVGNKKEDRADNAGNRTSSGRDIKCFRREKVGCGGHAGENLLRDAGAENARGDQGTGNIADLEEGTGKRIHRENDNKNVYAAENEDPGNNKNSNNDHFCAEFLDDAVRNGFRQAGGFQKAAQKLTTQEDREHGGDRTGYSTEIRSVAVDETNAARGGDDECCDAGQNDQIETFKRAEDDDSQCYQNTNDTDNFHFYAPILFLF